MEVLPNELLFECFSYLDALHIFYAFDGLNSRFSMLIRSIPLYLDFGYISTQEFYKICLNLITNEKIKEQIYSLKIINQNQFHRQIVESANHIDGFVHLRSLSLNDANGYSDPQWNVNFSNLPELHCFHTTSFPVPSELPISQMRILTLPTISDYYGSFEKFSSITNLTVSRIFVGAICDLLKYASKLRFLHWIGGFHQYNSFIKRKHISNSLKQLTIETFEGDFAVIVQLLECTPYLTTLTLIDYEDEQLFSVHKWQSLIDLSLKNLLNFNLSCTYMDENHSSRTEEIFRQFQADFWIKSHLWYTGCMLFEEYSIIYTIPYIKRDFQWRSYPYMYSNEIIDRRNLLTDVKKLEISTDFMIHQCPYYFPNLTTIEIGNCDLTKEYCELFKTNVNLTNLIDLHIGSNCKVEDTQVFLELLKQSPYISSLSIECKTLSTLLDNNDQLCEYLSKRIKKLTLISTKECTYIDEQNLTNNKFWQTFACIEQFRCDIRKRQSIQFLFESLSNLSYIIIHLKNDTISYSTSYLQDIASELGIKIHSNAMICAYSHILHVWINR